MIKISNSSSRASNKNDTKTIVAKAMITLALPALATAVGTIVELTTTHNRQQLVGQFQHKPNIYGGSGEGSSIDVMEPAPHPDNEVKPLQP